MLKSEWLKMGNLSREIGKCEWLVGELSLCRSEDQ